MANRVTGPTRAHLVAKEFCQKHPEMQSLTLAKMLAKQHPKLYRNVEAARSHIRNIRGNSGNRNRHNIRDKSLFRPNGKSGELFKMPESLAQPWTKFELDGPCKVLSLSDIHIPYHDPEAIKLAVAEGRRHKIDTVLVNGDLFDFYQGSTFEKDPEKREMTEEIRLGVKFMLWLQQQFKHARCIFKLGNHDERWERYVCRNAPVLWGLDHVRLPGVLGHVFGDETDSQSWNIADYGWEIVGDKRPVMAGKLAIWHGHELPRGISSPVNPARGLYLKIRGTGLMGHCHQTSQHTEGTWERDEVACWSQGCLSDLTPEYARINKYNSGAAIIHVFNGGEFDVHNFRIADGKVRAS